MVWAGLAVAPSLAAQTPPVTATDVTRPVFRPVAESFPGSIELANGAKVDPQQRKSLIVATVGEYEDPKTKGKMIPITCTASLIGHGVILTAAHCIDTKAGLTQRVVGLELKPYPVIDLTCEIPTSYVGATWADGSPRNSDDYALCRFAEPANLPPQLKNLRYEVLDTVSVLTPPAAVLMSGFGCKQLEIGADGLHGLQADGRLTIGDNEVTNRPAGAAGYIEIQSDWDTKPALCPGDSGGPLFGHASTKKPADHRRIVGVNSAVRPKLKISGDYDLLSRVAALSTPGFTQFLEEWRSKNSDLTICGAPGTKGGYPCAD